VTRRVVLDTNVLVSALISSAGNPAMILDMVKECVLEPVYCARIIKEYREVLGRARFGFHAGFVSGMLDLFDLYGVVVEPDKSAFPMSDESDRIFYDTAVAASANLITGNIKHFPPEPFIFSPAGYINSVLG
jgi:putative PIN family toxin of toxin-antitoxin system